MLRIYITIVTTFGNKMILRDGTFKVVPYFCIYFHNLTLIKFRVGNFSETPCTSLSEQAQYSTGMSTVCLKQQVSNKIKVYGLSYPILDTRISSGLRQAQATPPGFGNGLDWRALVKDKIPNIGKLRGQHFYFFFRHKKNILKKFQN